MLFSINPVRVNVLYKDSAGEIIMKFLFYAVTAVSMLGVANAQYGGGGATYSHLNHYIPGIYDLEFVVEESEFDGEVRSLVPCPDGTDCDSRGVIQINYGGTGAMIFETDFIPIRSASGPDGNRHATSRLGSWRPVGKADAIKMKFVRFGRDTTSLNDDRPLDGERTRNETVLTLRFNPRFSTIRGTYETKIFLFDFELDGPAPEPIITTRGSFTGTRIGFK